MGLIEELQQILAPERVSQNLTVLEQHSKDESYHTPHLPEAVVFPESAQEVSDIIKLANKHRVPVIPFGMGSSLEGHVIPRGRAITIDFTRMNKIVEIREKDFLVRVQPGVTRKQLEKELKKYGLFFPVDPGADASIGGMAATNASGTTTVKYGAMRDNVRDLQVVLADGQIIHTGNLAAKSSSGYHLTGLFVGSEGTLGCFTEITLKVYGIPEQIMAARAVFPNVDEAVEAVVDIQQAGIPIARVELVDEPSIRQVNKYSQTNYKEAPTLFLEFHGNKDGLKQDVALTKAIAEDHHCQEIVFETDQALRHQLWDARHNLAYAFLHAHPGKRQMVTDVCLPITELAGAIHFAREIVTNSGLPAGIAGHVGDGNFHIIMIVDPNSADDLARAEKVNEQIVQYALERKGTCTGEHGVGIGKLKYQAKEHGGAYQVMQKIKQVLDPMGIMNPSKKVENETVTHGS